MAGITETTFDREGLARWYAKRHFAIDIGVQRIFFLPKNVPPREIRLLEVNGMIPETTPLEPIDFGVDIDSPEAHTLYVLDITPAQWESIQSQGLPPLPAGWTLDDVQEISRV